MTTTKPITAFAEIHIEKNPEITRQLALAISKDVLVSIEVMRDNFRDGLPAKAQARFTDTCRKTFHALSILSEFAEFKVWSQMHDNLIKMWELPPVTEADLAKLIQYAAKFQTIGMGGE